MCVVYRPLVDVGGMLPRMAKLFLVTSGDKKVRYKRYSVKKKVRFA